MNMYESVDEASKEWWVVHNAGGVPDVGGGGVRIYV